MNDFKSYMGRNPNNSSAGGNMNDRKNRASGKPNFDELKKNVSDRDVDQVQKAARKYEHMSERELEQEIKNIANRERTSGGLSNADIDHFVKNVSPMLTNEQRARLAKIIGQLKR